MNQFNKKILIISSYAPPMVGGPQNLYNLFSQFPKNSFSILTSSCIIQDAQQSKVFGSWLPCKYYFYDSKEIVSGETRTQLKVKLNLAWLKKYGELIKSLPFIGFIYNLLGAIYLLISTVRKAMALVKQEKRNLIIGISDAGHSLITTFLVSKIMRVPYVLYLFDLYKGSYFQQPYRLISKYFEKPLIKNASLVIITNEATEEFYRKRYGKKIRTAIVYNSVFVDSYKQRHTHYSPQSPYTIIFTGNVFPEQEQSLLNLIKAVDLLSDLFFDLHLYVPKPTKNLKNALLNKKNIKLTSVNQSEMPKIQSEATLLFLPLSWNVKNPDIIATATPGKFTDYLASGRPMLVHAPDYAYVSQYTKEHQLGLVVDKNDIKLLANTIRNFLKNPLVGQKYIDNALKIFYNNHDAKKNAEKLIKLLEMV